MFHDIEVLACSDACLGHKVLLFRIACSPGTVCVIGMFGFSCFFVCPPLIETLLWDVSMVIQKLVGLYNKIMVTSVK